MKIYWGLTLRTLLEEQLADQFRYFNFSSYLVIFRADQSKKNTLYLPSPKISLLSCWCPSYLTFLPQKMIIINYSVILFLCEIISALKSSIVLQETTIDKCWVAGFTNNIINPNCFMSPVLISIWRYQEMVLAFWPQLLNQASYMLHSYPRLSSKMNKCLPICTRCIKLKSTEPS